MALRLYSGPVMQSRSRSAEPATEKRRATEADVLRATAALLAEGASYANLGVERIATRAGISRTAFYFYFADKRDLLMRLASEAAEQLYREADTWWSGSGDGPAQIAEALGKIAALYRAHGPLVCAIVEVSTYDAEVGAVWRGLVGRFVTASAERIEAEQAAGRADRGLDPAATAFALVWMTERSFHQMLVQEDPLPTDELVAALARVWSGAVYGVA
ncbi:MAG: TetR/AcrR family transcriptional regulator, ethionamide resistance regulator [Solirubrobacteraceae bacterium]|jgi:AcrR family transcriptional regulator|nr:TetR/AcrR family transcriptional regulator, ethionamide resistance regulator [Solirubrobacteraceae bacterium]